jgi:hypothetical protein
MEDMHTATQGAASFTSTPWAWPTARTSPTWLVAISMACEDDSARNEVVALTEWAAGPRLSLAINLFDRPTRPGCERLTDVAHGGSMRTVEAIARGRVRLSNEGGHKTVFWKKILSPSITSSFDIVWLLDCDVRVSPHLMQFEEVAYWFRVTGAAIVQPSVIPFQQGGRGGRGSMTRSALAGNCLARRSAIIEQMTPIFRREAFDIFWTALQAIPDRMLRSDSGIEALYCGLAQRHLAESQTPCVVLTHVSVVHLNTHTIHRYERNERQLYANATLNLLPYPMLHFPVEMAHAYTYNATTGKMGHSAAATTRDIKGSSMNSKHAHSRVAATGRAMGGSSSRGHADGCWGV